MLTSINMHALLISCQITQFNFGDKKMVQCTLFAIKAIASYLGKKKTLLFSAVKGVINDYQCFPVLSHGTFPVA